MMMVGSRVMGIRGKYDKWSRAQKHSLTVGMADKR